VKNFDWYSYANEELTAAAKTGGTSLPDGYRCFRVWLPMGEVRAGEKIIFKEEIYEVVEVHRRHKQGKEEAIIVRQREPTVEEKLSAAR
jgi:hypothetical protein